MLVWRFLKNSRETTCIISISISIKYYRNIIQTNHSSHIIGALHGRQFPARETEMDLNWEKNDPSSKQKHHNVWRVRVSANGCFISVLLQAISVTSSHYFALNEPFIIHFYNENPSLTYCHLCDNENEIMRTIQIKSIKDTF